MRQSTKKRFLSLVAILALSIPGVMQSANQAEAVLSSTGPINAATDLPAWYQDSAGLRLELQTQTDGAFGLAAAIDPANPLSAQVGFGAESFYWTADSEVTLPGGGTALLIMATEAAYAPFETPTAGFEQVFNRIRVRLINPAVAGTYTVVHPYGTTIVNVAASGDTTTVTDDLGCLVTPGIINSCNDLNPASPGKTLFSLLENPASSGPIGSPWLTRADGVITVNPFNGKSYISTLGAAVPVKGSPTGNNFFRVTDPLGNTVENNNFSLTGKISTPAVTIDSQTATTSTPTITGTVDNPTATVSIKVDALPAIDAQVSANGTWTATVTSPLTNGIHEVIATATASGVTTTDTTTGELTINVAPVDIVPPVITLNGASTININVGSPYVDAGATASDNVDGVITSNIVSTGLTIDTSAVGTFTITYNVSDAAGNAATPVIRTVNVVTPQTDTIAPTITVVGPNPAQVQVGAVYTDQGATATDNVDASVNVVTTGIPVDTSAVGTFTVTYTATDIAGNIATAARTVNVTAVPPVIDTVAPVITLNGQNTVTITVGSTYTDQGATATDNVDTVVNVTTTGLPIDTSAVGTFTVTYSATDAAGNTSTATRAVNVAAITPLPDTVPPVITLNGQNIVTITVGSTYTDQGATATDNVDGDVTASISTTGLPINTFSAGSHTITYTVTDQAGNQATATRTVNVEANVPDDNNQTPDTTTPVYRFWSEKKQAHFFTASAAERDQVIANDPSWTFEGIAYKAFDSQKQGTVPVFRFWSDQKQGHFFTISEAEKNNVEANDPSWKFEGIAYYVYDAPKAGTVPTFRFWSEEKQHHFYTESETEREEVETKDKSWRKESVAWFVPR